MRATQQKTKKRILNALLPEVSVEELKPKQGGRQSKKKVIAGVQQILDEAAPYAATVLRDHVEKRRGNKNLKSSVQRAAEYIIDHAIGKARQKIEHSGGIDKGADELSDEELAAIIKGRRSGSTGQEA